MCPGWRPATRSRTSCWRSWNTAASSVDIQSLVKAYNAKFGLDKPLWQQYLAYMQRYRCISISAIRSPIIRRASPPIILHALPWTIGLLITTTLLAFVLGTLLGALTVWRGAPRMFRYLVPLLMIFSAVPFYLFGLILIYVFATVLQWLPLGGGMGIRDHAEADASLCVRDPHPLHPAGLLDPARVHRHLGAVDARHDGDRARRGLHDLRRGARADQPAALPAIRAAQRASCRRSPCSRCRSAMCCRARSWWSSCSAIPASASNCSAPSRTSDYFVIYGIVLVLICAHRLAMLVVDLIYPLLDPRIRHGRGTRAVDPSQLPSRAAIPQPAGAAACCVRYGGTRSLWLRPDRPLLAFASSASSTLDDAFPLSGPPSMPPDADFPSAPTPTGATCSRSSSTARC